MYQFTFEKLEVWQKSRALANEIYSITHNFPEEEKFGLTRQIRRAMVSVCSNIAEGSARSSLKDQKHFYEMSFSSLMEVMNQLIISLDLGYLNRESLSELRKKIEMIAYMLTKLRDSRVS